MDVFHDDGRSIGDFLDSALVRCPRCRRRAEAFGWRGEVAARLVCGACGLARTFEERRTSLVGSLGADSDPPLWLQGPCVGRILWAYNMRHVHFLDAVVSARLRLRSRPVESGHVNKRLASRLPKWLLAAKHRAAVLHGLVELRRLAIE